MQISENKRNRSLPSSKNLHFQNNISCENEFYLHENAISKAEHLTSFLIQRPGGTRKWPIDYTKKEFNSHRICLKHQHGRRFIVLEHQHGSCDAM